MTRINVGCGQTPTRGWRNFDNSASVRLASIPFVPDLLLRLGILERRQYQFIRFLRENRVEFGDATRGLPVRDSSVDVLYSSHMLEHLDRIEVTGFLREAARILRPGGILRVAVPDIRKQVEQYTRVGDADLFIESTQLCVARPRSFGQRLSLLLVGPRHHQWMYDGPSLSRLLASQGFVNADVLPLGRTRIPFPEPLDLHERAAESVYVEAERAPAPGPGREVFR